jgi:RNA polymerase sigma factor (sigma-70 family)
LFSDYDARHARRMELFQSCLPLGYWVARKFVLPPGLEREDVEQVCLAAVYAASDIYNPELGRFSTIAYTYARCAALDLLRWHRTHALPTASGAALDRLADQRGRPEEAAGRDDALGWAFRAAGPGRAWLLAGILGERSHAELARERGVTRQAVSLAARRLLDDLRDRRPCPSADG